MKQEDNTAAERGPRPRWRPLLLYLAPAVLVVVAVQQSIMAKLQHLSPWKGGGFAMFSSIDSPGHRVVRAFLVDGGRDVPIVLPPGDPLEESLAELQTLPSSGRLEDLAGALAARTWRIDRTTGVAVPDRDAAARASLGSAIRLEVFRIRFYPETSEVVRTLIASASRERP